MAVAARTLIQTAQIPPDLTTQYTVPGNTRTIVDKMTATNPTGAAVTFTVYLVPSGGAAAANNRVISEQVIAPGGSYLCPEVVGHILSPGDFIATSASAAALTVRASGREVA